MGAVERLTAYIAPSDYDRFTKSIYSKIQEGKPCIGSNIIKMEIDGVHVEIDISNNEEDFEDYQVDQLELNTLYLTDEYGFALDCEEEIADLIDEMIAKDNDRAIQEAEREYQYA